MLQALFRPLWQEQQKRQMGFLLQKLVAESDVYHIIIRPQKGEAG